jgi:hypothetical protein
MSRIATLVDLQTPWECRWTRLAQPAHRSNRQPEETLVWICTRGGCRRHVKEQECELCENWRRPNEAE